MKKIKSNTEKKSKLVQVRVTETDKSLIEHISDTMNIRQNKLVYVLIEYGLERFLAENPQFSQEEANNV